VGSNASQLNTQMSSSLLQTQVAYAWATSLNEDEAATLLRRLNLGEAVVDHATELQAFNHAFQLAQLAAKHKLPDVHLKYAMYLEDCGRFQEAEGEFVAAGGQVAEAAGVACIWP
jgi:intraflagellar transport protein 172